MTLYRVTYSHEAGTSQGYGWSSSRAEAQRAAASFRRASKDEDGDASIERIDIPWPLTVRGLVDLLNQYATHADNG